MVEEKSVLVIEDHPTLLAGLADCLTNGGMKVFTASNGLDGVMSAKANQPDMIILDLQLPDLDGISALKALRRDNITTPVLILSARDSVGDRIKGLDSGADDYMVKPFSLDELMARLRCLLRREPTNHSETKSIESNGVLINRYTRCVTRNGETLDLTPRDYQLLECLVRYAGKVVSRETLATEIWKSPSACWTNVIEVQIRSLRQKLERRVWPELIHTIRGQGYMFGELQ